MAAGALARVARVRWRVAAWGAFASVGLSLLVRAVSRGRYYPGWDLLAATEGHFIASTQPLADGLRYLFEHNRRDALPFPLYSLPFTVVPGYLETLWPWEYWAHLVTLVTVILTLLLIVAATKLPWSRAWVVVLAWGASSTLLSFSLAGFPWASAFLPHAIALWIALDRRRNRSALLTLGICLVASETSWHVYELGKTIFVVFFAAALLLRVSRWRTRVVFLAMGVLQLWWVRTMPTSNTVEFTNVPPFTVVTVLSAVRAVLDDLLVSRTFDVPILCVAGMLSLLAFRRDRVFVAALLAVQLGLLVALATIGVGHLRPRRFLMVDFYALVAIACAARDMRPAAGILVPRPPARRGERVAARKIVAFVRAPRGTYGFTLPYTQSQADYMVPIAEVDSGRGDGGAGGSRTDAAGGVRLPLLPGEPHESDRGARAALPPSRPSPLRPLGPRVRRHAVPLLLRPGPSALQAREGARPVPPGRPHRPGVGRPLLHPGAAPRGAVPPRRGGGVGRDVRGDPRAVPGDAGVAVGRAVRPLRPGAARAGDADVSVARRGRGPLRRRRLGHAIRVDRVPVRGPLDRGRTRGRRLRPRPSLGAEPFGVELSARLHVSEPRRYEFLLGADQPATLSIDGATVVALSAGDRFHLAQGGIDLPAGSHAITVTYAAGPGPAHLLVDMLPASVAHPDAS